jgi:hypothetical protein
MPPRPGSGRLPLAVPMFCPLVPTPASSPLVGQLNANRCGQPAEIFPNQRPQSTLRWLSWLLSRVEIAPADFSGPRQPISIPVGPETNHRQISDDYTSRHLFPYDQQVSGAPGIDDVVIAGAQGLGNGITSSYCSRQYEIVIREERRPNKYRIYPCSEKIEESWTLDRLLG